MELSKYLRDYSRTVAGKEQLIIAAVAKSLEIIPRQLCDNAGFDATNILNRLREKHAKGVYSIFTPLTHTLYCFSDTQSYKDGSHGNKFNPYTI